MLEIRGWSEQYGLLIHKDIPMAKFIPLKQGKYQVKILILKQIFNPFKNTDGPGLEDI